MTIMLPLIVLALVLCVLAVAATGRRLWGTLNPVSPRPNRHPAQHHFDREFRRIVRQLGPMGRELLDD